MRDSHPHRVPSTDPNKDNLAAAVTHQSHQITFATGRPDTVGTRKQPAFNLLTDQRSRPRIDCYQFLFRFGESAAKRLTEQKGECDEERIIITLRNRGRRWLLQTSA